MRMTYALRGGVRWVEGGRQYEGGYGGAVAVNSVPARPKEGLLPLRARGGLSWEHGPPVGLREWTAWPPDHPESAGPPPLASCLASPPPGPSYLERSLCTKMLLTSPPYCPPTNLP